MTKSKNFINKLIKRFKFGSMEESEREEELKNIAPQEQKHIPFEALVAATENFHPSQKLGEGGFGPVFKGKLNDGREIAVKRLSKSSNQGVKEFKNEAKLLAGVQHRNVVNLLGYCVHGVEKLLVYEYISNHSLDKLLFKSNGRRVLDWKRRYEIINGIARGLLYLHEDSHNVIIHRDIKASNILLDDNWVPKIADFGMARLYPEDQTHVKTRVAGTNGYMAPEYVRYGNLSASADVFSFGVLLLELISGRRNSSFSSFADARTLLDWAYELYKRGRCSEIVDPALSDSIAPEQVAMCTQIGLLCVQDDPKLRPTMQRVVVMLSKKHGNLVEPRRPSVSGSRYRKGRKRGGRFEESSSNATHSSSTNTATTSAYASTSTMAYVSATATIPTDMEVDALGKLLVKS